MELQLKSKKAFISGSTQGIGYAIAKALLLEGTEVIMNGRTQEKIDRAIEKLKSEIPSARVSGIAADFTKPQQIKDLLAKLPEVDILINNVGVFELKSFADISDQDWIDIFEINVLSSIRLSRALFPGMLKRKWGRIIFISSESAINIPENMIHYGMTKTAMLSISRGLAELTKNTGVTVNSILGGPTYSDGVASAVNYLSSAQDKDIESVKSELMANLNPTSLINRFIDPSEIANLAVYLSSPLSIATNGSALRADGGVLNTII